MNKRFVSSKKGQVLHSSGWGKTGDHAHRVETTLELVQRSLTPSPSQSHLVKDAAPK